MAGGKFSNPRPHRDEERQIEQAFRQVTGQAPKPVSPLLDQLPPEPEKKPIPIQRPVSQDTVVIHEARIEEAIRQVRTQQSIPSQQPPESLPPLSVSTPKTEDFDLLPEDLDSFFDPPQPEGPEENDAPDFIDKMLAFFSSLSAPGSKKQTAILLGICGICLLVIVSCIALFFAGSADPNDGKILDNVYLADIPVGGMTKSEAISAVKEATSHTYGNQDMVIDLSGTQLRLSPKDTRAQLDVKAAVNEAYQYGRTGTKAEKEYIVSLSRTQNYIIGLLPYLELDQDYIQDTLQTYANDTGSTLTQTTYGLEGREPELSAEGFNENAPTQTLVITLGTPGIGFDVNDVFEQVLDAYSLHSFLVTVENVESVKEPDPIDLDKIYKEYYIKPVDASVNLQTFQPIPGSYGYGFDLEEARKLLEKAEFGDILRIPMEYIAPDVLDGESFFQDVLGDHQTRHTSNEDRNTNLRLACQAINGTVLDPGETFSFNSIVGQRTSGKGYKTAPADASAKGETVLGGGISQVSSTLYYAAMLSDLEITSRRANQFAPSFIDYGMDAAVSWDLYDFAFRNNLGYPIRIQAEVSGGYVRVKILGTEERNHYVLMDYSITKVTNPITEKKEFPFDNPGGYLDGDVIQEGVTGYTVKTYKVKYDLGTSQQISRDYVGTTDYAVVNKIVAKVLPEETEPPTEAPTTAPPTTAPPTTVPPTTVPPTTAPPATEPPAPVETQPSTEPPAPPETQVSTEPLFQEEDIYFPEPAAETEPIVIPNEEI